MLYIPKTDAMNTTFHTDQELALIVDRITQLIFVEQLFLYRAVAMGKPMHHLYVFIRHTANQGFVDSRALCEFIVAERPNYRCHVSLPGDVNHKIKHGNMRVALICHPSNLVFEHPDAKTRVELPGCDYILWREEAIAFFEREISKIKAFAEGHMFYVEKGNLAQASFMLHQVLEISLRTAENILLGKEKFTHSLRTHHGLLASYSPEISMLFQTAHELHILERLDESYKATRYDHYFSLALEDLSVAFSKAQKLIDYLNAFQEELLAEIDRQQDIATPTAIS